jgi:catalase
MIRNSAQQWEVGQTVKVGFLNLVIRAKVATPGDGAPDAYILVNAAGTQLYRFVPHHGVEKVTVDEARDMLAAARQSAEREAAAAVTKARADACAAAAIAQLLAA